jgi:hypothetical protein
MKDSLLAQLNIGPYKLDYPDEYADFKFKGEGIGAIISALLPYIYALAGLALLLYLIWGGFDLLTSGGNPESVKRGQSKVTNAVVGFIIVFISYWLIQAIGAILGIEILKNPL